MFDNLVDLLNKRKELNQNIEKGYLKIIIGIILVILGLLLPSFLISKIPFLMNLSQVIDAFYMSITNISGVITPSIYVGITLFGIAKIILNTIRIFVQKKKLKKWLKEEENLILEIKENIEKLSNENSNVKEQIMKLNESKKQMLNDLKKELSESKNNKNNYQDDNSIEFVCSKERKVKKLNIKGERQNK